LRDNYDVRNVHNNPSAFARYELQVLGMKADLSFISGGIAWFFTHPMKMQIILSVQGDFCEASRKRVEILERLAEDRGV
jgi:hypothetical protein